MRYQITFSKTDAMRFTGHLDLHTTLERTMRRANLPLVYSERNSPRALNSAWHLLCRWDIPVKQRSLNFGSRKNCR